MTTDSQRDAPATASEEFIQQETSKKWKIAARFKKHISAHSAWYEALWIFSFSRLVLILLTVMAVSRIPPILYDPIHYGTTYDCAHNLKHCVLSWLQWDAIHYTNIARYGYFTPQGGASPETAFFPLWPLLMHLVAQPFGTGTTAYYLAGELLANICFYFALVLLYFLIREEFTTAIARKALFFLAFFPYTLFFSADYTEALFLLLTVGMFCCLRQRRWLLAGACGYLATLTRSTGIVLAIPFFVVLIQQFGVRGLLTFSQFRQKAALSAGLLLIPAGLLTYMLYLKIQFGDPLYFVKWEHIVWFRTTTWPWAAIILSVKALFNHAYSFELNLRELIFTLLPLAALALNWRRIPLRYSLFALAVAIFALSNPSNLADPYDTLGSIPRYIMIAFPIFIIYAQWAQRPRVDRVLTVLFLIYFCYHAILFVNGYWVA